MRSTYLAASFLVSLLAIVGKRNEVVANLLGLTNPKNDNNILISGVPLWGTILIILAMLALVLAFVWNSALRAWICSFARRRTANGSGSNNHNIIDNNLEVQMVDAHRPNQSPTMVAPPVGDSDSIAERGASSGGGRERARGGGKRRGRSGSSSSGYAAIASSASSVVGAHESPPGSSSNIHHSSTPGSGGSRKQQKQRRPSVENEQQMSPLQQPTGENSAAFLMELAGDIGETFDKGKKKKQKGRAAAAGGGGGIGGGGGGGGGNDGGK
jgi:hypothetical protein